MVEQCRSPSSLELVACSRLCGRRFSSLLELDVQVSGCSGLGNRGCGSGLSSGLEGLGGLGAYSIMSGLHRDV